MNPPETVERPDRFALSAWIIVALALVLRGLHVFFTLRYNPLAADLQLDAAGYDRWANALAFGGDPGPTTLMQAPIYPWFLSLLYRVFGPNLLMVRSVQALVGTASCGLIMLCTRRFFRSTAAAILAGLFAALYAPLIFYEGLILPATIVVFLNILFVTILFTDARPGTPRIIASGVVLGAAGAANPPTLLLFPFALLHLKFAVAPSPGVPGRAAPARRGMPRFLARSLLLTSGIVAAIAPVAIRNAVRTGEFIPLTTGAGINLYLGNNPAANGFYKVPAYRGASIGGNPEEQAFNMAHIASSESGRALAHTEVSNFWLRASIDYIRDNPRTWGSLLWKKFIFFWNGYERASVENFYFHRRFRGVLRLPLLTFGAVVPLGLLGIFLTRSRWRRLWLLYGGVLTYVLTALIFYVLARYRLPAVAFLMPFAGAAVVELVSLARSRRIAELVLALAALGPLAFFSNMTVAKDTPRGVSSNLVRLGNVYIARGDTTMAARAYRDALAVDSENEEAKRGIGSIRERTDKPHRPPARPSDSGERAAPQIR
jgi:hypothetical protein